MEVPTRKPNPGSKGGTMTAMRMSPEQRSARSTQAGNTTLRRYGTGYYAALGRLSGPKKKK